MKSEKYRVMIAESGKRDVIEKKAYIIRQFKYRKYAENFSQMIKRAVKQLETLPRGYGTTGFQYRGYDIYIKPQNHHLLFYTVDEKTATVVVLRILQDDMDWRYLMNEWLLKHNSIY